jgi:prefoldin alpha subunit
MNEENSEAQLFEYQARQLQQVLESVDAQMLEINNIIESLSEFEKVTASEALFPIANGIFAKGTIDNDKMLKINVGNNVVVEKSIADTILMMKQQLVDVQDYKQQIMTQMNVLVARLESMNEG